MSNKSRLVGAKVSPLEHLLNFKSSMETVKLSNTFAVRLTNIDGSVLEGYMPELTPR